MHRSYQSTLPTHNKLLQQRWDSKYYGEHRRLVSEAKPMVDSKPPQTYMHLHLKLKKLQLEEERLATIERDNRILLEKMSYIMRTRGRIDNKNEYEYKSLNREKRMRELLGVTEENTKILQRILKKDPEYSVKRWEQSWDENQRFMDNISSYPKGWWQQPEDRGKSAEPKSPSSRSRRSSRTSSRQSKTSKKSSKSQKREQEHEQVQDEQEHEQVAD